MQRCEDIKAHLDKLTCDMFANDVPELLRSRMSEIIAHHGDLTLEDVVVILMCEHVLNSERRLSNVIYEYAMKD